MGILALPLGDSWERAFSLRVGKLNVDIPGGRAGLKEGWGLEREQLDA